MAEALLYRDSLTSTALTRASASATVAWEVQCQPDGRAGVLNKTSDQAAGTQADWLTAGQFVVPKTSGVTLLDGGPVYWDHSANAATFRSVSDKDFYLGTAVGDAASAAVIAVVNLNVRPTYKVDLARDGAVSATTGTAAAGGFGYPVRLGGSTVLELTATNEAQKVDALSVEGFAVGSNWIVEAAFRVISDGSGTAADFSLGLANGTHGTDADSITEHLFAHLDANTTNINLQSKDGTTTVASTDTTADYAEGSALSNRVEVWFDGRTPADPQVYVDGVNVLPASVFSMAAASGPLYLLAHLEKTSSTDTYKVSIDWLRVRISDD
jgi:predicted RecA/RadA family phage recombinase